MTIEQIKKEAAETGRCETAFWWPGMSPSERESGVLTENNNDPFDPPDGFTWISSLCGSYYALTKTELLKAVDIFPEYPGNFGPISTFGEAMSLENVITYPCGNLEHNHQGNCLEWKSGKRYRFFIAGPQIQIQTEVGNAKGFGGFAAINSLDGFKVVWQK